MVKKVRFWELFLIVSFVIVIFLTKITIGKNLEAGSNIGSQGADAYKGCADDSAFCWNYVPKLNSGSGYAQGIRLTVIDQAGNRVNGTKSVDFFLDVTRSIDFLEVEGSYSYSTKFSKIEILNDACGDPINSGNYFNRTGGGSFNKVLKYGASTSFPKYMGIGGDSLKSFFINLAKDNFDSFQEIYLTPLNYNLKNDINENKNIPNFLEKRAILIEPLAWLRLTMSHGRPSEYAINYAGTVTEIAKMLRDSNNVSKESTYNGDDSFLDLFQLYNHKTGSLARYDGITFGSETALHRLYPTSIYIDNDEFKGGLKGVHKWVTNGGVNYGGKGTYELKNGTSKLIPNYVGELLKGNGFAAGHVWFDEIMLPCEDKEYAIANPYDCCVELYSVHNVDITPYLNIEGDSCCAPLYNFLGSSSMLDEYCLVEPDECEYKLDVKCPPENCEDVDPAELLDPFNLYRWHVKDIGAENNINDWKCIFESTKSNFDKIKNHYIWTDKEDSMLSDSNPYCEVYCREEIQYDFPLGNISVLGGHHFTVGTLGHNAYSYWGPIKFEGLQECRTKGKPDDVMVINHEKFVEDYAEANDQVKKTWDRYQEEIAYDNWIKASNAAGPSSDPCDFYCEYNCSKCSQFDDSPGCYSGGKCCVSTKKIVVPPVTCPPKAEGCTPSPGYSYDVCNGYSSMPSHSYVYYPVDPQPKNGIYYSSTTLKKWCPGCDSKPSANVAYYKGKYDDAVAYRALLLKYINQCSDWVNDFNTFEPAVYLEYEEDMYGFTFDDEWLSKLKIDYSMGKRLETYYTGDDYQNNYKNSKKEDIESSWVCDKKGEACKEASPKVKYPINDNKKVDMRWYFDYSLQDNIYNYVTKPPGFSFHDLSDLPGNYQYLNIGYSNLPIHFSRLERKEGYELNLKYTTFGPNNKFNKYILPSSDNHVEAFPYEIEDIYACPLIYECRYLVDNKFMYCDKSKCEDLQVIFRPISLSNPFPGITGTGRIPGENWRFNEKLITNNRNLANPERIYFDKEPMYEINLNSGAILSIRQYNRNATGGYADFNLNCIVGEGRECKSEFIRNSDFTSLFENRCGMSADWKLCADND